MLGVIVTKLSFCLVTKYYNEWVILKNSKPFSLQIRKGFAELTFCFQDEEMEQTQKIVDLQKQEIKRLRNELRHTINRPLSNGQKLPPMELQTAS